MENHVTNCGENLNRLWKKTIRLQEDRIWRLVERIWREGEIATGESAHGENCGGREKGGDAHGIEKGRRGPHTVSVVDRFGATSALAHCFM
jgi:hypothetical protein